MERLRRWLAAVAGRDPVECRQAYLLQIALLALSGAFLLATVSNALRGAGSAITTVLTALGTAIERVLGTDEPRDLPPGPSSTDRG